MENEPAAGPRAPLDEARAEQLRAFLRQHNLEADDLSLIDLAFTHSSHAFEQGLSGDNERLEFLGDAVLGLLVSLHLYASHEASSEGDLSKLKAQLVSRNVLGRLAFDLRMGDLMRLGRGEEQTGGRRRFSLLGSALEALIGAIYLDQGLDAARRFVSPFLLNVHDTITQHEAYQDYKSQLQELVQRRLGVVPRYETTGAIGPDHDKTFSVTVAINGEVMGTGQGRRVKSAENRAAHSALTRLRQELGEAI
ncbi:MAG: ribonuclease III [Candidatus Sumerlaeia bacterium]|nr:ribonuclease III [Candidatus Sumerlaeia bacterium]